jgi:hypothetical protein
VSPHGPARPTAGSLSACPSGCRKSPVASTQVSASTTVRPRLWLMPALAAAAQPTRWAKLSPRAPIWSAASAASEEALATTTSSWSVSLHSRVRLTASRSKSCGQPPVATTTETSRTGSSSSRDGILLGSVQACSSDAMPRGYVIPAYVRRGQKGLVGVTEALELGHAFCRRRS